jgi:peptide/nickel transport system ATP-binding protein
MSAVLSEARRSPLASGSSAPVLQLVPDSKPLISIRGLTVAFDNGVTRVPVLHGVDLDIRRGEAVGIVGESGCGKSVTWLAVLGLLGTKARITGSVYLDQKPIHQLTGDQLAPVRGKRIAMIFQDPASALNPVHSIGKQLLEVLELHRGLRGQAARAEALRLLDRVHIPNPAQRLSAYPHELSGGTNQRVMIAMALAGEPDMLVADEPTTALDATIQAQILQLLAEIRRDSQMAMALISHDLGAIAEVADRVLVMYAGRVVEQSSARQLFDNPRHPYTRGLLAAMPNLTGPRRRLVAIPGSVPEPGRLPSGCSFRTRCTQADDRCAASVPAEQEIAVSHRVSCLQTVSA